MQARALLGPEGPLARSMGTYELRPGQLDMAEAVERTLSDDGLLLVEAGTGTGKTLAYLVPALLSGKKIVISTGTKTLQDQLMNSDIPLLAACLGSVDAACMKGLSNYLCLRRYHELMLSADAGHEPFASLLRELRDWEASTPTGDRAELEAIGEDSPLWTAVQSGTETRIGTPCRHFDRCFVTAMRLRAEEAQLVVVNHHLFFADLALRGPRGRGVLPDYDAVVLDEAHLLEDIATDFFGVTVSASRIHALLRDARRSLAAANRLLQADPLLSEAQRQSDVFFAALPKAGPEHAGRVPLAPEAFDGPVREQMFALDTALDALASHCSLARDEALAALAKRAHTIRRDVSEIAEGGGRSHVTWTRRSSRNVAIGASPVQIGEILKDRLWYTGQAAVLTSATLSAAGSFDFLRKRLGIDFDPLELVVPSPFVYEQQVALYLPDHLGDPRTPGFAEQAAREIIALVNLCQGGAFVLCTSLKAMRELAKRCRPALGLRTYVQGEAPKAVLLARFREDGNAVLFATASFWQGVDVPGRALRLVVVDKLPFEVPTDPLVAARCRELREQGRDAFREYVVPTAALALKQGFGRLIRTRHDRGIVAVLDGRLRTRGYGKWFVRTLPPAHRCERFEDLARFWRSTEASQGGLARSNSGATGGGP
ncbi:MAG: ATP-dependent DNA helicase [Proteobacteria bacterium]|nr:ATP-dependent DNA helicase [Pseudomonadota bacterium]